MVNPSTHNRPEMLDRHKRYVESARAAWDEADDARRNRLVSALFGSVLVHDRHLVAVQPCLEVQPILVLPETETPIPVAEDRR